MPQILGDNAFYSGNKGPKCKNGEIDACLIFSLGCPALEVAVRRRVPAGGGHGEPLETDGQDGGDGVGIGEGDLDEAVEPTRPQHRRGRPQPHGSVGEEREGVGQCPMQTTYLSRKGGGTRWYEKLGTIFCAESPTDQKYITRCR